MDVFTAVADPTRRQVLDLLLSKNLSAGEIGEAFPSLSQPAMSRHLKVLREVGLLQVTVSGQHRIYSLQVDAFIELSNWISRYQTHWGAHLDALASHLDTLHPPDKEPRS